MTTATQAPVKQLRSGFCAMGNPESSHNRCSRYVAGCKCECHVPKRIQRRRTTGWRMPDGAVCVSRPSRWGNPFRVTTTEGRVQWEYPFQVVGPPALPGPWVCRTGLEAQTMAVELFALHTGPMGSCEYEPQDLIDLRAQLGGHDLACWCDLLQPCHVDVLLPLANPDTTFPKAATK